MGCKSGQKRPELGRAQLTQLAATERRIVSLQLFGTQNPEWREGFSNGFSLNFRPCVEFHQRTPKKWRQWISLGRCRACLNQEGKADLDPLEETSILTDFSLLIPPSPSFPSFQSCLYRILLFEARRRKKKRKDGLFASNWWASFTSFGPLPK